MHFKITSPPPAIFSLAIGGLAAGTLNGVFGTGGGIIGVFALSRFFRENGGYDKKDIFAMTLFSCFFMSVSSAAMYLMAGHISFADAFPYAIPALAGGIVGAFLLDKIKTSILSKIFALLIIYSGVTLFLR